MAAEAAISSAVELLGNLLVEKVKFLRGVEGEVQLLKEELKRMQLFLGVANRKAIEDPVVRKWISDLREVGLDTEDMVEMFLINHSRKSYIGFAKCVGHLDTIGHEVESIRARLDAIDKSRDRYGIKDLGEAAAVRSSQVEWRRRLAPWKKEEEVVGLENDVKKLLRESILDKEKKGLSIAVVEGMGGIGKSTLARAVYNHPDVVAHGGFEWRAWVVVSAEFNPHETMKQLMMELPESDRLREEIKKLEESTKDDLYLLGKLQEMLYKQLEGKSYLIVVDDVWEKEHWESLTTVFPNQQGITSRVLVTTRNKAIAKLSGYAHEMKGLDADKSWELFLRKTFIHESDGECPEELEPIGRKMVKKCHGLPLAISVVGGLLVETRTKSGWEEVLNQINSHLGRAASSVSAILELSYQNLSPYLKSCFLCLAFFKEDAIIPVKRLVHIWMGQGLIQQEVGRSVGEIARGYLAELVNRNVVQINDWSIDGRVKNCRLHDLVREVCLRKAKEEIGLEIVKVEGESSSESGFRPRHRVVHGTFSLNQNEHIRSLFLVNVKPGFDDYASTKSSYWKKFHLIKTVDLDGFLFRRFPQCFRALLGLKYLRIGTMNSGLTYLELILPTWLDHLEQLEVLDLGQSVKLPNRTLKMDRLRYFFAHFIEGPLRIESWRNIETLKYIAQKVWMRCNSSCGARELGIMLDLESGVDELSRVRDSLEKMENLVSLHLDWHSFSNSTLTLIPIPNLTNLTQLKLRGMMTKCPDATTFPPNLCCLTLSSTVLHEDPMPQLGKLPKLLHLKLSRYAFMGERMRVLHDGFPCLKTLSLHTIRYLKTMDIQQGGMPQLQQLRLRGCPALHTNNLPQHILSLAL